MKQGPQFSQLNINYHFCCTV